MCVSVCVCVNEINSDRYVIGALCLFTIQAADHDSGTESDDENAELEAIEEGKIRVCLWISQ